MKKEHAFELLIAVLALLPFAYLAMIWNGLPDQVATHFNFQGVADRYSSKNGLVFGIAAITLLTWALLKFLPAIDPKKKLQENPGTLRSLRLMMAVFTTALAFVIIQSAQDNGKSIGALLPLLMGGLFAGLGNYLINVKPNYFIGIRTPWTLESESVWRKTHRIGGKMFFAAGIVIILSALLLPMEISAFVMIGVLTVATLVPVYLSYKYYQEEKRA